MDVNPICPVCNSADETLSHVLKDCHYARLFWALANFPTHIIYTDAANIWDWIDGIRRAVNTELFDFFVCGCWKLWSNRNHVVHDRIYYDLTLNLQ